MIVKRGSHHPSHTEKILFGKFLMKYITEPEDCVIVCIFVDNEYSEFRGRCDSGRSCSYMNYVCTVQSVASVTTNYSTYIRTMVSGGIANV